VTLTRSGPMQVFQKVHAGSLEALRVTRPEAVGLAVTNCRQFGGVARHPMFGRPRLAVIRGQLSSARWEGKQPDHSVLPHRSSEALAIAIDEPESRRVSCRH